MTSSVVGAGVFGFGASAGLALSAGLAGSGVLGGAASGFESQAVIATAAVAINANRVLVFMFLFGV